MTRKGLIRCKTKQSTNQLINIFIIYLQVVLKRIYKNIPKARKAHVPEPVLDFGPERGSAKGTMADLGPFRHIVSTRLPSGGRAALLSPS